MNRPINVVGGGLAGLTLGIGLRHREIPVTLWEAGTYPRHRVCGEFVSGRGRETLDRIGLSSLLREAGGLEARSVMFGSENRTTPVKPLPSPALCLSRFEMDHALAREFVRLGGDLRSPSRWSGEFQEGVVSAVGRGGESPRGRGPFLGLKVHARGARLEADLEMHFVPGGYVGLCRLPNDKVNVCGLFRTEGKNPDLAREWPRWLSGSEGSVLSTRLSGVDFEEESFCATAGFSLEPRSSSESVAVRIGDALTMIPPLVGNGMSMAFEGAEIAVKPVARFSLGEISWVEAGEEIARECDRLFERRLRWASRFHPLLFNPIPRSVLMFLASRSDWLWERLYSLTR